MKHSIRTFMSVFLCASLLFLFGCTKQEEKEESKPTESKQTVNLTISAAASLQDALTEIQKKYEKEHEELLRIHKLWRIPIILVTHNHEEAKKLGDRILYLHEGKIHDNEMKTNLTLSYS